MGRIAAGLEFGQVVAQPVRAQPLDISPGLNAVAQTAARLGAEQQAEGLRAMDEQQRAQLQAEREARAMREKADASAAQAKLYNLRDSVADELERVGQEVLDGRLPKTEAPKAWQERTAKLITDNIADVPEAHRGLVQQDLQGLVGRLTSKVGDVVRKRDQQDTAAAITQTLEHTQRLAVTDPEGARGIMLQTLDQLGPAAGMTPDQIAKTRQGWVESTAYTRAFTAVNAAKGDNKALGVVEQAIGANADLDPQRKAALLATVENYRAANEARALRQAQHAEIAAARVQRQSDEAFGILQGWALQGKQADPNAAAGLISRLTPTAAAAYKAIAAEIPARTAVAMLPLEAQAQQLDTLKARAVTGTSVELEREIKRREEVLAQARKDYADDPLRAANERGVITTPLRPLDTSSLDRIAAGLVERAGQAQEVATVTRRPVSPLLADEARRFGDMLGGLPVAERGRRIAQLAEVLPAPMMLALAQQVGGEDKGARRALALEMQFGADKTVSGRYRSELVARGAQAIKDKGIKEDTSAEFGLRAQIAKEVGDSLPPRWREDAIEAARLMYLGQQAENGSPSVRGVVRLAAGGDIVEHNGRRIPIPAGLDEGGFRDKLKAYPADAIARQAPGGAVMLPGGKTMPVGQFLQALPEAVLEPVAPGRYGVRAGGGIVMGGTGRPIIIEVR
jgi:hypothetical protein